MRKDKLEPESDSLSWGMFTVTVVPSAEASTSSNETGRWL